LKLLNSPEGYSDSDEEDEDREEWGGGGRLIRVLKCRWHRVAKTHRMPYLDRSFSAKEPYD